jgi:hypothetical protein
MNRPSSIIPIPHSPFPIPHFNSHSPFPIPHSFRRGNAYIEYLVFALVVLLATIAFYQTQLRDEGVGVRKSVEQAFDKMVDKVLKP